MAAICKTSESTYMFLESIDHTLDDIQNPCPLDNGRHSYPHTSTLGNLEQLPLELINMLLIQLDIQSLTNFRRANQRAMQVIDQIPQYKKIILYAPSTIQGIPSINTGASFSCQELYTKLCTAECDICGDVGGYLYLVTCRRVCFLCFTTKTEYLPLLRADAMRKFGLSRGDMAGLPFMRSVPGYYSPREVKCRTRMTLLDHDAAREAGIAVHGSIEAMVHHASEVTSKKLEQYEAPKIITRSRWSNCASTQI